MPVQKDVLLMPFKVQIIRQQYVLRQPQIEGFAIEDIIFIFF